jgi:predicted AlkP superfamily pyrophosphatase or phosphodiesterase
MSPVTLTQQILGACLFIAVSLPAPALSEAKPNAVLSKAAAAPAQMGPSQPEHIILFVVEGIGPESLKGKAMPVLGRLVNNGSATWSAAGVNPPLRLPTMASLVTGMPVEKHGITWDVFDFARGYPRPPTVFDYLDASGGKDSAIFLMDESLYQLAKPEPYTDFQICGPLKPECTTRTIVSYVQQYMKKATSGHGYGHAILSLPHFLIVHLPEAGRAGQVSGWTSPEYRDALRSVDKAIGSVMDLYKELGLLSKTTIMVTGLSGYGATAPPASGHPADATLRALPWIAYGPGIKAGHVIGQPVSILDTGATVMRAFGLDTHMEWDSRAIEDIFVSPRVVQAIPAGK